MNQPTAPKDNWFICGCCTLQEFFYFSYLRIFAVVFPVLVRQDNFTRQQASDVFGVILVTGCLTGSVVPYLEGYFGSTQILFLGIASGFLGLFQFSFEITHARSIIMSLLYGIGRGCVMNQGPAIVGRNLPLNKSAAFAIMSSGQALSCMVFSVMTDTLLSEYGIRGCHLLFSGIVLQSIMLPYVIKQRDVLQTRRIGLKPEELHHNSKDIPEMSDEIIAKKTITEYFRSTEKVMSNPRFWLIISATLTLYIFLNLINVFLDVAIDKGVAANKVYLLNVFSPVYEVSGYITGGVLAKNSKLCGLVAMIISQVGTGLCFISSIWIYGFWPFMIIRGLLSFCISILVVIQLGFAHSFLGEKLFARGFGLAHLAGALIYFGFAPLVGFYRDQQNNYDPLLFISGLILVVFGLLWLIEPFLSENLETANQINK